MMPRSEQESSPPEPAHSGRGPARLAPAAIGVWAVQSLVSLIPAALVFFVGSVPLPAIGLLLALFQVTHVVTWLRFRWQLDEHALVIDRGLLQRQRRVIPRDRVQSVDLERTLVHRLLGVSGLRVEAIGAGDTEGWLPALDPELADRLRTELLESHPDAPSDGSVPDVQAGERPRLPEDPELVPVGHADRNVLIRCSPRDLLVAGITGGRIGVGAAILGLASQIAPPDWVTETLVPGLEQFPDPLTLAGLRILLTLFGLAVLVGFLASLLVTLLVHWNFTLVRTTRALEVSRGLLTERRDTVPFRRIQAVRIEENWIRRLLGLASVKVVVAGRAGASQSAGSDLILPVGSRAAAFELAGQIMGLGIEGLPELVSMPGRARDRRRRRAWVAALGMVGSGIALGMVTGTDRPWLLGLVVGALCYGPARLLADSAWRSLGWANLGDHVVLREGALTRRSSVIPFASIQELRSVSNPFQRRRRLATLELHIARPIGALSTPRALDLDADDARVLRERWARVVAA